MTMFASPFASLAATFASMTGSMRCGGRRWMVAVGGEPDCNIATAALGGPVPRVPALLTRVMVMAVGSGATSRRVEVLAQPSAAVGVDAVVSAWSCLLIPPAILATTIAVPAARPVSCGGWARPGAILHSPVSH